MSTSASCPPVLVLAFNRPDATQRVLDALRAARPARVFFAVDGPRPDRAADVSAVREVHDLAARLDWGCEVRTLFRERNLGCKRAVSEAISWFFEEIESGIILEDDCLPSASFFRFCEILLDRFRDDPRVFSVQGNFFGSTRAPQASYLFSKLFYMWGWASWADRWKNVRVNDLDLAGIRRALEEDGWLGSGYWMRNYWLDIVERQAAGKIDSWGYPVMFHCFRHKLFNVTPTTNLVLNIGIGPSATRTAVLECGPFHRSGLDIDFPLVEGPKYAGAGEMLSCEYRWRIQLTPWRVFREVLRSRFPRLYGALRAMFHAVKPRSRAA